MDMMALKEEVIAYSRSIGIDKIGFASADPFVELKERLRRQQELGYQSGFEEPDIEKRTNPSLLLPEAKSIIAIALAYPSKMKDAPRGTKTERRGLFCRASWGKDYHVVLRERLQKLEEFLLAKVPSARVRSMVDTGELADRAVAERAGIGWSGKNCSIITPEFGSYVYLGEMITNIPFPPDEPVENRCGTCTKCIDACPTGALVQGGQLNAQRCISFLTQTKGFLADEFREKIGNRLYGCDTCQLVCPENKGKDFHLHPEFEPDPEAAKPKLVPLLDMTNREFQEKFGDDGRFMAREKTDSAQCDYCPRSLQRPDGSAAFTPVVKRRQPPGHPRDSGMGAWENRGCNRQASLGRGTTNRDGHGCNRRD